MSVLFICFSYLKVKAQPGSRHDGSAVVGTGGGHNRDTQPAGGDRLLIFLK